MSKRGRPPKRPNVLQVDQVDIDDIGRSFVRLGEQLVAIGETLAAAPPGPHYINPSTGLEFATTPQEQEALVRQQTEALLRFLSDLGRFTERYDQWRHVAAEYAARGGFSYRAIGDALGVSSSTVTRWLADPVELDWNNIDGHGPGAIEDGS